MNTAMLEQKNVILDLDYLENLVEQENSQEKIRPARNKNCEEAIWLEDALFLQTYKSDSKEVPRISIRSNMYSPEIPLSNCRPPFGWKYSLNFDSTTGLQINASICNLPYRLYITRILTLKKSNCKEVTQLGQRWNKLWRQARPSWR